MKTFSLLSMTALLFAGLVFGSPLAPLLSDDEAIAIDDRYIVVLKDMHTLGAHSILEAHQSWLFNVLAEDPSSSLVHVYNLDHMKGYAGVFSADTLSKIRSNEMVDWVERDQVMSIDWSSQVHINLEPDYIQAALEKNAEKLNGKKKKHPHKPKPKPKPPVDDHIETQPNAPWGLARLSSRSLPTDMTKFSYPSSAGADVDVYVVDTGISIGHADFEGRAVWGKTIPQFDQDIDGNGHGTHVAGTIAAKTFGIAKKAKVIAVKVLRTSGYGSNADVISGVEWVIGQHKASNGERKSVANMSLGGGRSQTLDRAVNAAVTAGVHFAVAAGNDSADACNYSPAGADLPMTVGASTIKDGMAYFSNRGSCVDIFAPGLDITSTWIGSANEIKTISGTSMASPHVAGVMALFLGDADRDYTTDELKQLLIDRATQDMISDLPEDTVNALLNINSLLDE